MSSCLICMPLTLSMSAPNTTNFRPGRMRHWDSSVSHYRWTCERRRKGLRESNNVRRSINIEEDGSFNAPSASVLLILELLLSKTLSPLQSNYPSYNKQLPSEMRISAFFLLIASNYLPAIAAGIPRAATSDIERSYDSLKNKGICECPLAGKTGTCVIKPLDGYDPNAAWSSTCEGPGFNYTCGGSYGSPNCVSGLIHDFLPHMLIQYRVEPLRPGVSWKRPSASRDYCPVWRGALETKTNLSTNASFMKSPIILKSMLRWESGPRLWVQSPRHHRQLRSEPLSLLRIPLVQYRQLWLQSNHICYSQDLPTIWLRWRHQQRTRVRHSGLDQHDQAAQ